MSGSMSVRTVGSKKLPLRPPPATTSAPWSIARLTWSSRRSAAAVDDSGPISLSDEVGSPGSTAVSAAVNFSRERLVEVVDHDEPLGGVARLPCVVETRDAWPLDDELRATAAAWGIVPERDLVLV